ncbi:MAG: hypothetical protein Q8T08_14500 [Ignavibacteria bacterium]|nr:hypothetical protein [Ignavibacteria bacterium]
MNQESIVDKESTIDYVAFGKDTGIDPLVLNEVEHIPYITQTSSQKTHVYFTAKRSEVSKLTQDKLKERAQSKIDPRITYSHTDNNTIFHGILITPEYRNGKFSQPVFDWLLQHCDQINKPLTGTTSINKPTISLFMQKQEATYGFKPDSMNAIAEILEPSNDDIPKIRWLYNILPTEDRICKKKTYTFYEVEGDNGIISKQKRVIDIGHYVVAMHTTFSRKN